MKNWKRNAVIGVIVVFVCAAAWLNWSYSKDTEDAGKTLGEATLVDAQTDTLLSGELEEEGATAAGEGSDYFASARLNREEARASALSLLESAAGDEGATQTVIDEANASIQTMADFTVSEAQIENLVTAKGYRDCIAFLADSSASVVVSAVDGGLSDADTAKISEIVMEQTGLAANQIKIIEAS